MSLIFFKGRATSTDSNSSQFRFFFFPQEKISIVTTLKKLLIYFFSFVLLSHFIQSSLFSVNIYVLSAAFKLVILCELNDTSSKFDHMQIYIAFANSEVLLFGAHYIHTEKMHSKRFNQNQVKQCHHVMKKEQRFARKN